MSTPLSIKEISDTKEYFRKLKKQIKRPSSYSNSSHYHKIRNKRLQNARKGLSVFERVYKILSDGNLKYPTPYSSKVQKYIEQFPDLSELDKELVVAAISSGDSNGILVAKRPMMKAYRGAVQRFGLEGCFICDGFKSYVETL